MTRDQAKRGLIGWAIVLFFAFIALAAVIDFARRPKIEAFWDVLQPNFAISRMTNTSDRSATDVRFTLVDGTPGEPEVCRIEPGQTVRVMFKSQGISEGSLPVSHSDQVNFLVIAKH